MKGLCIDINSINKISAAGSVLGVTEIIKIYEQRKYLFYDSTKGEKPFEIGKADTVSGIEEEFKIIIVDASTDDGKVMLEKLLAL